MGDVAKGVGSHLKEAAASPPSRVQMWVSQFKRDVKKLERPGEGLPPWSWSWHTSRQERWRGLDWVSLATRR